MKKHPSGVFSIFRNGARGMAPTEEGVPHHETGPPFLHAASKIKTKAGALAEVVAVRFEAALRRVSCLFVILGLDPRIQDRRQILKEQLFTLDSR